MALLQDSGAGADLNAWNSQQRRGIAKPEWRQREEFFRGLVVQFVEAGRSVQRQLRDEIGRSQAGGGIGIQTGAEIVEALAWQSQTRRLLVSTEAAKQLRHGFQGLHQMKCGDAPAGAAQLAVLLAEHEHRAAEALHQAAGYDADHTPMPVRARKYQRALRVRYRLQLALLQYAGHDLGFGLLAFLIQRMELFGQRLRFVQIGSQKQADHIAGVRHASRGIDSRGDLKSHLMRAGSVTFPQTRD